MPNLYDSILKTQHLVEARGNALADDLVKMLEDARTTVVGKLAELQAKYLTGAPWDMESYARRKAFLEAQRAEIDRIIAQVYQGMTQPALDAIQDVMEHVALATGKEFAALKIEPSAGVNQPNIRPVAPLGSFQLSLPAVAAWAEVHTIEGLVLTEWLGTMSKNSVNRIVAAGREAMILGLSVQDTAKLMRQKGIEGGVNAVRSLARTYLLSASNHAHEQVYEANRDIIGHLRYNAVLDGRTCLLCGNDDGKLFRLDEPRPTLQRHINCRCMYTPVVDWEKMGIPGLADNDRSRPAVKETARTVHHRDGTTSTKFTVAEVDHTGENYNAWITRQLKEDPAFVKRVLRKTRFELFESGHISLEKMVVDGRIRRLSEISN